MQQFKSPGSAQRFPAVHVSIYSIFNVQRHLISRNTLRQFRDEAMLVWRTETAAACIVLVYKFRATLFLQRDNAALSPVIPPMPDLKPVCSDRAINPYRHSKPQPI